MSMLTLPVDASGWSSADYARSGYITMYAACPLIWATKLQTEVVLLTIGVALLRTKAEYIALSQEM